MRCIILKYIIVNADDFGRHEDINAAVEKGLREGCLRSATVMPGGRAFAGAIALARRYEELGLGVHFTPMAVLSCRPKRFLPW